MKPGDHPEFFRLPPPDGRSRESGIVLDREGRFWHHGQPVEHAGMARAFGGWVTRHPDDGRYVLSNGYDWSYLTVEGTPYFVVRVCSEQPTCASSGSEAASGAAPQSGGPWVELSDGSFERLELDAAAIDPAGVLSVAVKGGKERAAFTRTAQLALEPMLHEDSEGLFLEFEGRRAPLPRAPQKA